MKSDFNKFVKSEVALRIGIALLLIPIYLLFVEEYRIKFLDLLISIQVDYPWGTLSLLFSTIGSALIYYHLDEKRLMNDKHHDVFFSIILLIFIFAMWTGENIFVYFSVLIFIALVYFVYGAIKSILIAIKNYLLELDNNLQLALIIPVLTVILNYVFGR